MKGAMALEMAVLPGGGKGGPLGLDWGMVMGLGMGVLAPGAIF